MDERDLPNVSVTVKTYHRPGGVATALHEFFVRSGGEIDIDISQSIESSDASVSQSGSEEDDVVSQRSRQSVASKLGDAQNDGLNLSAHSKKMQKKRNSVMEQFGSGAAVE